MILPDVNVLVFAFRREADEHDAYAAWLRDVVATDELALVDAVLLGFLRIVTNPRVVATPAPTGEALRFADALVGAPRTRWIAGSPTAWSRLGAIARADAGVRANLVPDAWLAALAIAHGCRLATADRGFARFEGLRWFVPVDAR